MRNWVGESMQVVLIGEVWENREEEKVLNGKICFWVIQSN
jgi:hypothetical protein